MFVESEELIEDDSKVYFETAVGHTGLTAPGK